MNKILTIASFLLFAQVTQAFQTSCEITDSSARGIEEVTVAGPMNEHDFRIRLFDQSGTQIETGACDFSGECYERDDRTLSYDVLSDMYISVIEDTENTLRMKVYPSVRQGVIDIDCKILR